MQETFSVTDENNSLYHSSEITDSCISQETDIWTFIILSKTSNKIWVMTG